MLYRDFDRMHVSTAILSMSGVILMFFGVFLITSRSRSRRQQVDSTHAQSVVGSVSFEESPSRVAELRNSLDDVPSAGSQSTHHYHQSSFGHFLESLSNDYTPTGTPFSPQWLSANASPTKKANLVKVPRRPKSDGLLFSAAHSLEEGRSQMTTTIDGRRIYEPHRASRIMNTSPTNVRRLTRKISAMLGTLGTHEVRRLEFGQILNNYGNVPSE